MTKFFIFTLILNLAFDFCQSQSIVGFNNQGRKIVFFLPNDEKKDSLLENNPEKKSYHDLIIDNVNNWKNISVQFGIFIPKTTDTLSLDDRKYVYYDDNIKDIFYKSSGEIYFVSSQFLNKSIDYTISLFFLNNSSDISVRYTPNGYFVGFNSQTKHIVWERYSRCAMGYTFSFGELCGYQKPMLVLDGKKFICLKNKRYLFLPFRYSKMILINWENGKETVLKTNVFNIKISPNADYLIYEKGNRTKNKRFQIYDITQKKVIKEIVADSLFWNN